MAEREHRRKEQERARKQGRKLRAEAKENAGRDRTGEPTTPESSLSDASRGGTRSLSRPLAWISALVLGAIVAAGIVVGAGSLLSGGAADDSVTAEQREDYAEMQARLLVSGGAGTRVMSQADALHAIESDRLGTLENKAALIQAVLAGRMEVREMAFYDSHSEDGDVVDIRANGALQRVALMNAPTPVLLPYIRGQQNVVSISGVTDGGGGITLGVVSGGSPVPLTPIAPGTVLNLPLR